MAAHCWAVAAGRPPLATPQPFQVRVALLIAVGLMILETSGKSRSCSSVFQEEKELILYDWAADAAAKLVAGFGRVETGERIAGV